MGLKRAIIDLPPREEHPALELLSHPDADRRRHAALSLSEHPEAAPALSARLRVETHPAVRDAILVALGRIGGELAVEALLPLLRSDDAALRNGALGILSTLPDAVASRAPELLGDPDPDVRILAVNLVQTLVHPCVPDWLRFLVAEETHVNVAAALIEALAEHGGPEDIELLGATRHRFAAHPFVAFAVDMALARIGTP